eukprot:gene18048-21545_t
MTSNKSTKYLITHATYKGVAEDDEIRLSCDYTVKVFDCSSKSATRLSIPLIAQKATLTSAGISLVDTKTNTTTDASSTGACIVTSSSQYQLIVSIPGTYAVSLKVCVPYLTAKKTGMELPIPLSSQNSISFQVQQANANIKIFNAFVDSDATADWVKRSGKESVNSYTIIFAKLPQEHLLRVQWTIKSDSSLIMLNNNMAIKNDTKTKPPSVVVHQDTLGSIGEGLLILKSSFKYKIVTGTISLIRIAVDSSINIINVEGEAVKKWEIVEEGQRVLHVCLDYGVESSYELTVSAEHSMRDTTADVAIPTMAALGDEIVRHRGFLAIEARTNVEISEISSSVIDVIDVQEVPTALARMATHPILLAYKFLEPIYALALRVKKNSDVAVLVSIVESAHFLTTISYTGRTIHQLLLSIKNTTKQYLRITLPFEFHLWSTLMDGMPVRPSCIANAASPNSPTLLMPLLRPANAASPNGDDTSVQIEIVVLEREPRDLTAKKGRLSFTMPKVDLPLRAAHCTIYLPDNYSVSKHEGNLKKASRFSAEPPRPMMNDDIFNNIPMNNYNNNSNTSRNKMRYSAGSDDDDEGGHSSFLSVASKMQSRKKVGGKQSKQNCGVIPVRVDMPTTYNVQMFQQILLSGQDDLTVSFNYTQKSDKGYQLFVGVGQALTIITQVEEGEGVLHGFRVAIKKLNSILSSRHQQHINIAIRSKEIVHVEVKTRLNKEAEETLAELSIKSRSLRSTDVDINKKPIVYGSTGLTYKPPGSKNLESFSSGSNQTSITTNVSSVNVVGRATVVATPNTIDPATNSRLSKN